MREFSGHAAADDVGAVRHFHRVRHVGAGREIEDGGGRMGRNDIQDLCNQIAGVQADRLAGFKIDLFFAPTGFESLQ